MVVDDYIRQQQQYSPGGRLEAWQWADPAARAMWQPQPQAADPMQGQQRFVTMHPHQQHQHQHAHHAHQINKWNEHNAIRSEDNTV